MPTAKIIKRNFYVKTVLKAIFIIGIITVASTSPYFWPNVLKKISKRGECQKLLKTFKRNKVLDTFSYLKSKGMIKIKESNKQIYISLTDKGKRWAGKYQINDLKIKKPKTWDKKWRIEIFDVKNEHCIKRESLRGKLKQLDFYQIQKSVWAYPYECTEEVNLLRKFFGLSKNELKILLVEKIEEDQEIKEYYRLI